MVLIRKKHIFRFCPTFDMLCLNVCPLQKYKKHLCCNLLWVPTQFDWTMNRLNKSESGIFTPSVISLLLKDLLFQSLVTTKIF